MSYDENLQITSDIGRWGRIPLWLLETDVSAGAIKLFALMDAKWADRETKTLFPSLGVLAEAMGFYITGLQPINNKALKKLKKSHLFIKYPDYESITSCGKIYGIRIEEK